MNLDKLLDSLRLHEDLRLKPYKDTVGKTTIGIGRNLDDVGISEDEALLLCQNDIASAVADLEKSFDWFHALDDVRQNVLIEMRFNLGITRLLGFTHMLQAIKAGACGDAANEMLNSQWARQVGQRAITLSTMMRTGEFQ